MPRWYIFTPPQRAHHNAQRSCTRWALLRYRSPASFPRSWEPNKAYKPLHQLPGWLRYRWVGNLWHNELYPGSRQYNMHWAGSQHGKFVVGGRSKGEEVLPTTFERYGAPAEWRVCGAGNRYCDSCKGDPESQREAEYDLPKASNEAAYAWGDWYVSWPLSWPSQFEELYLQFAQRKSWSETCLWVPKKQRRWV